MSPVYIPSKNRADAVKTYKQFKNTDQVVIVIEPQDQAAYEKALPKASLMILGKNDQGIVYVRNFILEHAIEFGYESVWMLDDDISQFVQYEGSKAIKITANEALAKAEQALKWQVPNIGQGAIEYSQFSWSQTKEIVAPGYCDVAVLLFPQKMGKAGIRYRPEMNLKEDRDFTLQVLSKGMLTGRAAKIAFIAPKNGSNAGGLSHEYAVTGREAAASQRMIKAWPGICTSNVKKDGRPDVKINWKAAYKDPSRR